MFKNIIFLQILICCILRKQVRVADGKRIQLLVWAPVGSGLAFVVDNDVYYQSEDDRSGTSSTYKRITTSPRDIYNGVADWVYEGWQEQYCIVYFW